MTLCMTLIPPSTPLFPVVCATTSSEVASHAEQIAGESTIDDSSNIEDIAREEGES